MIFPLTSASPLLILAVILITGVAFGNVARALRLPGITGQILAGVLIGSAGLNVFEEDRIAALRPLTTFALGLVAVTVGAHLNFRRLRNAARRLSWLVICEALFVPTIVFLGVILFPQVNLTLGLLFGAVAVATAPATIVAIVKEGRAKGVFVKTLVAAVALNNLLCIFLFELARLASHEFMGASDLRVGGVLLSAFNQLLQAAMVGALAALFMAAVARFVPQVEKVATAGFITLLVTVGMANYLGYSSLMACLFLGLTQTNVLRERDKVVDTIFSQFEPAILTVFFMLAGMELTLDHASVAGGIAVVFFLCRALGKTVAGRVAMRLAGATDSLRRNLGIALVPQAGVAVGLVVLLKEDPVFRSSAQASTILDLFAAVVVTAVVFNEIAGPILTRWALVRSGEVNKDRERLLDFIHEENIFLDLEASSLEDAIAQLVDLTVQTHHLSETTRESLLASVMEREVESSTALGNGLAVPHGMLPPTEAVGTVGVMAVNRAGFPFVGPDNENIRCIVLLASGSEDRERHLQILAALARTVGSDPKMQMELYHAKTPAHVYDLLHHHDEAEDFNYFLDDLA